MNENDVKYCELTVACREALHAAILHHKTYCDLKDCREAVNLLGWLCHTVGIGSEHAAEIGKAIDKHDANCRRHRYDELCRN